MTCQYCGTSLVAYRAQGGRRTLRCVKCGKRLPFDSFLVGIQICGECTIRGQQELEAASLAEEKRKCSFVSKVIAEHPELRTMILKRLGIVDFSRPFSVSYEAYDEISSWHKLVTRAKNLVTARRYEDAAKIYESLELWKEAGDAREKKGARTVKHVTVDLNNLIDKLRSGGLSVPYKCGSCGASITIDKSSNVDGLKFCSYCGSSIDTDSLMTLLQNALK